MIPHLGQLLFYVRMCSSAGWLPLACDLIRLLHTGLQRQVPLSYAIN